jgi:hypothetical protein
MRSSSSHPVRAQRSQSRESLRANSRTIRCAYLRAVLARIIAVYYQFISIAFPRLGEGHLRVTHFQFSVPMPPPVHFYMDDSGTRIPDRKQTPFDPRQPNHFSLGGVLILEEDEIKVRSSHAKLSDKWGLTYPLHSVDIRAGAKDFSWLRRGSSDYEPFMRDLTRMLTTVPVAALACVMDRPGYDRRVCFLRRVRETMKAESGVTTWIL